MLAGNSGSVSGKNQVGESFAWKHEKILEKSEMNESELRTKSFQMYF